MHQILKKRGCLISVLLSGLKAGLDDFEELLAPIVLCLEKVSLNMGRVCNEDTLARATLFYKLMTSFDFLFHLVITRSILDLTSLSLSCYRVQQ